MSPAQSNLTLKSATLVLVFALAAVGCVVPITTGDTGGNQGQPPPPLPSGVIPIIAGAWASNNNLTFDIAQNGNAYTWTCRERPIPGHGTITGTGLDAYWTDFGQHLSATGTIQVNAAAVGTKITWSNGVIFNRI